MSPTHRKLQVFVSSTYRDLRDERQAAVQAILTSGHIPAGMELFQAGNRSQWDVIRQWIDDSDVFLLILGGRYGSIEPESRKSFVELEYDYASDADKPTFSCVIDGAALEEKVRAEGSSVLETQNSNAYEKFKARVMSKMVRRWRDARDIKLTILESLHAISRREDLCGWVKASSKSENRDAASLAAELARVTDENRALREEIEGHRSLDLIAGVRFDKLVRVLKNANLLRPIFDNRLELSDGLYAADADANLIWRELALYQLVEISNDGRVTLTSDGKNLLSRILSDETSRSPA